MVIKVSAQQSRITYLKYFRKAVAGNFADEPIQMISLNIKWLTSFEKRETNENYNNTTVQLQEPPLQTNDESCLRCNMRTDIILLLKPSKGKGVAVLLVKYRLFILKEWCLKMVDIF